MSTLIYENIEFHNVAELEEVLGLPGFRLQRFPKEVRNRLGHGDHERGRFYAQVSVGCEIRFVTSAKFIKISLSSLEQEGTVYVYKGDYLHSVHSLPAGAITTLHLEEPAKFAEVDPQLIQNSNFAPKVWRLLFGKNSTVCFHALDCFGHQWRVPTATEKPTCKLLAYGSSITFGGDTNLYTNAYIQQAARRLGWDVYNKGIAGSCFCEDFMAEYLSTIASDVVTLELGVNMRGRFMPAEFEERAENLIEQIRSNHPDKPIVTISIFPNGASGSLSQANHSFTQILENIVNRRQDPLLYFISGTEILSRFSGLTVDLLHPSDDGHIVMGENLANKLKAMLES
ncbi:MAG: lipase [Firmicutes bacterium]|nr:lipase [Bacillota bacterium]